jgi:TonB-linked SusC/RagA family outer membrane protein
VTGLALFSRQVNDNTKNSSSFDFPGYQEDWVGRLTYNYKERYLSEVNMAYNGSEHFAPGRRFGFFPSMSVGWRISEEPLVQKWIGNRLSNLKVRYSYGQVGFDNVTNSNNRWNYIQMYNSGGSQNYGYTQNVSFGPEYSEGPVANPASTWETSTKQNVAIEIGLWNKLAINTELYKEHRTGMLMTRQTMPQSFGTGLPSVNMGETKNHGLEFEANWKDRIGKDFSYNIGFNFAASENRILYQDDPQEISQSLKNAGKPIGWQSRYLAVGNYGSIDDIYNYAQTQITGVTASQIIPGDLVFVDYNGDGKVDANDQVVVKNLNYPLTTYALNLGCSYKGFNLSMMFYKADGVYKNLPDEYLWDFPMSNLKAQPDVWDSWTYATANSEGVVRPPIHLVNAYNDAAGTTYSYRDYSYIRLKNVELSYSVPKRILNKFSVSNFQVYINGNNLITWSSLDKRIDPETGGSGSYPIVRTYTTGLRLSF